MQFPSTKTFNTCHPPRIPKLILIPTLARARSVLVRS
jgi:hypothetical protein